MGLSVMKSTCACIQRLCEFFSATRCRKRRCASSSRRTGRAMPRAQRSWTLSASLTPSSSSQTCGAPTSPPPSTSPSSTRLAVRFRRVDDEAREGTATGYMLDTRDAQLAIARVRRLSEEESPSACLCCVKSCRLIFGRASVGPALLQSLQLGVPRRGSRGFGSCETTILHRRCCDVERTPTSCLLRGRGTGGRHCILQVEAADADAPPSAQAATSRNRANAKRKAWPTQ
mmetsp:Transcript_19456/g.52358  ORF Transcript_19456/g.52358 Transcript_19456/m.52358 type:complete len:230 (+) Transcript_19456:160-849(+)